MIQSKKVGIVFGTMIIASLGIASVGLASMLGISSAAAMKVINTASTVATIISLIGVVAGAGVVSTAIVATAKSLIKKYGTKYAAAW